MNSTLFTYVHLRHRHQLPALRRHLGHIERDIAQCTAAIAHNRAQRDFTPPTGRTKHRPEAGACDLMASYGVDDLRGLHGRREAILAAIAQLEARNEPARRLSDEARRAIAELPGTRPVPLPAGQAALIKATIGAPSLTGEHNKRRAHNRRRNAIYRNANAA